MLYSWRKQFCELTSKKLLGSLCSCIAPKECSCTADWLVCMHAPVYVLSEPRLRMPINNGVREPSSLNAALTSVIDERDQGKKQHICLHQRWIETTDFKMKLLIVLVRKTIHFDCILLYVRINCCPCTSQHYLFLDFAQLFGETYQYIT